MAGVRWGHWAIGRQGLYYLDDDPELGRCIRRLQLESLETSLLSVLPSEIDHFPGNRSLSVSDDEKTLYFSGGRLIVDLMLAEGF